LQVDLAVGGADAAHVDVVDSDDCVLEVVFPLQFASLFYEQLRQPLADITEAEER